MGVSLHHKDNLYKKISFEKKIKELLHDKSINKEFALDNIVRALAMVREEQVFRELRETPLALFVLLAAAEPCINGYNSVN